MWYRLPPQLLFWSACQLPFGNTVVLLAVRVFIFKVKYLVSLLLWMCFKILLSSGPTRDSRIRKSMVVVIYMDNPSYQS